MLPEPAELTYPRVDLAQRGGLDRVHAARAIRAHIRKAALPQHLEMLRHCRLRNAELAPDDGDDVAGGLFAARQQLQNPAAKWVAEDSGRVDKSALLGHRL